MDDRRGSGDIIRIETPEHVVFEYELAGLGSRIVAAAVDLMMIGFILLGLFLVLLVVAGGLSGLGAWVTAVIAVAAFATFWGYPIFFEIYWRGQTPGKRSLRMRVIQEGGYALTPQVVVVRNLLRIVDFLPGAYFLGLLVMMLNRRYKRIGDFVAGTIVIRDRTHAPAPSAPAGIASAVAGREEKVAELRRIGVHRLDPSQVHVIEDFMRRRFRLEPEARLRLSRQLAVSVSTQLGIPPERGEAFLACVLAALQQEPPPNEGGGTEPAP